MRFNIEAHLPLMHRLLENKNAESLLQLQTSKTMEMVEIVPRGEGIGNKHLGNSC
ncbi:uncharacterized protein BDW43DRAFT_274687 [Aspergillus alliaceus]|uniref:uncharacterized protein n=1 Tax=Petromyces alliaceus TaxID=209559 RepID=UPI0012A3EC03|nr:uncharacterized protein BDW43DRAFT_274687 [Aspergillus alliaceus]KAB8233947.1 hypothetical protein BDW43DRAFT_274687 [Aspergillus alliaceus]